MAGTVLLVSTSVACDMQQDRSTGWRLGTNRVDPVPLPGGRHPDGRAPRRRLREALHGAYPVLLLDQTAMNAGEQPAQWNAAMTFKFVGVLNSLTDDKPYQRTAIWIGVGIGLADRARCARSSSRASDTRSSSPEARRDSSPTSCSTRPAPVAVCVVVRRLRQPRTSRGSRPAAWSPASATRSPKRKQRQDGAAGGHEHHVALRRRPDRRRCARGAGARHCRLARDGAHLTVAPGRRCGRRGTTPRPSRDGHGRTVRGLRRRPAR